MIKIERGIPIPPRSGRGKYPLAEMQVGESFVLEKTKRPSVVALANRKDIKLVTRSIDKKTIRVWRVR